MVSFETIKSEEVKFKENKFIEIARKKAITDEGETIFISLSSGFVTQNGEKRYRKSFSLPVDDEVLEFVSKKIREV